MTKKSPARQARDAASTTHGHTVEICDKDGKTHKFKGRSIAYVTEGPYCIVSVGRDPKPGEVLAEPRDNIASFVNYIWAKIYDTP